MIYLMGLFIVSRYVLVKKGKESPKSSFNMRKM